MKKFFMHLLTGILLVFIVGIGISEAFIFDLLDKLTGNDRRTQILPMVPHPNVYVVRGKSLEEIIYKVKSAMTYLIYTDIIKEDKSDNGWTITAYRTIKPTVVNPAPEDRIWAKTTVSVMPADEGEGSYFLIVKGEFFQGFTYYHHKPPFVMAKVLAERIEKELTPTVILEDKDEANENSELKREYGVIYIGNTNYTLDDISEVIIYSSSYSAENFNELIQYVGGYSNLIGLDKIKVRVREKRDTVGSFKYIVDFYKFKVLYDVPAEEEGKGADPRTIIKLKDGKQMTVPFYKEDLFRKRIG